MTRTERLEAALREALATGTLPPDVAQQARHALDWRQLPKRERYPHAYKRPCPSCGGLMERDSRQCQDCKPASVRLTEMNRAAADARWAKRLAA